LKAQKQHASPKYFKNSVFKIKKISYFEAIRMFIIVLMNLQLVTPNNTLFFFKVSKNLGSLNFFGFFQRNGIHPKITKFVLEVVLSTLNRNSL